MTEELKSAIAIAKAEAEPHACVSRFLAREFGKRNASLLLRDAHGAVSRLHKAHRAMKLAIEHWDGSPRKTNRVIRMAVVYGERMHDVSLLCSAPPIRPATQTATMERRKQRTRFYRGGQSPKSVDASPGN